MAKLYIAYGSNMDVGQMAWRCPEAKLVGTGMVKGYGLLFKGSKTGSYATIEPAAGMNVPVLVWQITKEDERSLDRYEGYPNFYYKRDVATLMNGKEAKCMVYIMHEERLFGMPGRAYYDAIRKAYGRFGMDTQILETALAFTCSQLHHGMDVRALRTHYPDGTRVRLIRMEDIQAPPAGTEGTVHGVDDMGHLLVHWDSGGSLSLIPAADVWLKL